MRQRKLLLKALSKDCARHGGALSVAQAKSMKTKAGNFFCPHLSLLIL